jgi:hypothetical protein
MSLREVIIMQNHISSATNAQAPNSKQVAFQADARKAASQKKTATAQSAAAYTVCAADCVESKQARNQSQPAIHGHVVSYHHSCFMLFPLDFQPSCIRKESEPMWQTK